MKNIGIDASGYEFLADKAEEIMALKIEYNTNGGMAGGRVTEYVHGVSVDEIDLEKTLHRFKTIDGRNIIINARYFSSVSEVTIVKVPVNELEWNGKWVEECRYSDIGNITPWYYVVKRGEEYHISCKVDNDLAERIYNN